VTEAGASVTSFEFSACEDVGQAVFRGCPFLSPFFWASKRKAIFLNEMIGSFEIYTFI